MVPAGTEVVTRITQQELESYLWGAATVLRGLIDAGDYKQYVFLLMSFKRLSDAYDEEYERALGGETRTTTVFLSIPECGVHWSRATHSAGRGS